MQSANIVVEAQHVVPLMELAVEDGDIEELDRLLDLVPRRTVQMYNYVLRAYVNNWGKLRHSGEHFYVSGVEAAYQHLQPLDLCLLLF